jgi:hypothetical protein
VTEYCNGPYQQALAQEKQQGTRMVMIVENQLFLEVETEVLEINQE